MSILCIFLYAFLCVVRGVINVNNFEVRLLPSSHLKNGNAFDVLIHVVRLLQVALVISPSLSMGARRNFDREGGSANKSPTKGQKGPLHREKRRKRPHMEKKSSEKPPPPPSIAKKKLIFSKEEEGRPPTLAPPPSLRAPMPLSQYLCLKCQQYNQ